MPFRRIPRPAKARRIISIEEMTWDRELEQGILMTLIHRDSIVVDTGRYFSSPAKGRLWKRGVHVYSRRLDNSHLAVWGERYITVTRTGASSDGS